MKYSHERKQKNSIWKKMTLQIRGLKVRKTPGVEQFCSYISKQKQNKNGEDSKRILKKLGNLQSAKIKKKWKPNYKMRKSKHRPV